MIQYLVPNGMHRAYHLTTAATPAEQLPHRGQLKHLGLTVTPRSQVVEPRQRELHHLGSWLSHATVLDGWAT
ncbi:hypothetical protein BHM03_00045914 [Ensete ventricosum]|nr:hypothetical protein BHM03_00045914 [Ensete ventricosum]